MKYEKLRMPIAPEPFAIANDKYCGSNRMCMEQEIQ